MIDLQLDQLRTFAVVVEEGSFEAAARRLSITASAVSQRIKTMEQSIGKVLVRRSSPVAATEPGEVILRLARQFHQLELDAAGELSAGQGSEQPVTIPLAVNADSLATWFMEAVGGITGRRAVRFDLRQDDERHTAMMLRSGSVMAAVTAAPEVVQGCSSQLLGIMRYRAVASPEFVAEWLPDAPALGGLSRAPIVNFDRKDTRQEEFLLAATGKRPLFPAHYVPSSVEFAAAITSGLGWGMLPELQCVGSLDSGRLIDLAPSSPQDVPLYWQRWRIGSRLLDVVSDSVRSTARRQLIQK
ncbi:LysR family transcriptional regulator ArgP [Arthrobacter sp. H5]|uniref:LysR family transcriptional regulator ArgP n=1 Tax=Arthrobacter sp. H5 TaxID=1267973 RepID=UPI000483F852|nr:LysR family transcriptional regulator ArgP [Arthrobacter sp. H5]